MRSKDRCRPLFLSQASPFLFCNAAAETQSAILPLVPYLDIFFNNAGIEGPVAPIPDFPTDAFRRVMEVNGCWQTNANSSQLGQGDCPYAVQRSRHSARAAMRLALKSRRLERLRS